MANLFTAIGSLCGVVETTCQAAEEASKGLIHKGKAYAQIAEMEASTELLTAEYEYSVEKDRLDKLLAEFKKAGGEE